MKRLIRLLQRQTDQEPQNRPYKELDSPLIQATRYDYMTNRLYIRFRDGHESVYYRVTPYAYNAFLNADSHSEHFHAFIHQRYLHFQIT